MGVTGKKICSLMLGLGVFLVVFSPVLLWAGEEEATPQEVIDKINAAAAFLAEKGAAGIEEFQDPKGRWVWKDTYIWVLQCEKWQNVAHPLNAKLVGVDLKMIKDTNGKLFYIEFCGAAKQPKGGWVEYMWPKPNEKEAQRKITYVLQVPGQAYQVAAGIYNATITLEDLDKLIK
jgi:cytochrome c